MNITTFNTKIGKVENKLPNVSGLATRTVLYTKTGKGENKISDASGLWLQLLIIKKSEQV